MQELLVASVVLFAVLLTGSGATRPYNRVDTGAITRDATHDASKQTFLQRHVGFFDRNHDGIIHQEETFEGFRALGFDVAFSNASAMGVHRAFSQVTRPGKPPSPLLLIEVANIALAKHGSDTGVYDAQGNFVASKFEDIFRKHARSHPSALTRDEVREMLRANKQPGDEKGSATSKIEWKLLFSVVKDKDGLLHRDTVRGVYDQTLFERLEKERSLKIKD